MISFTLARRTALIAALFFSSLNGVGLAREKATGQSVAVSIKPLHSLISGLMEGSGNQPSLILAGGASPHAYSLKPSDAGRLTAARLIFWIGPGMEGFLVKPLHALAGTASIVTFVTEPDANPHIWLSPLRATAMVDTAVARLIAVDPGNAEVYRRNGATLARRLGDLQAEMAGLLKPVKSRPFIVFHDAFDHLAAAFGLNIAGVVTTTPERAPGARRIADLRKLMAAGNVSCLFAEPLVDARRLNMIVENIPTARIGILDPLGGDLAAGPDMYFKLMRANARALVDCLSD